MVIPGRIKTFLTRIREGLRHVRDKYSIADSSDIQPVIRSAALLQMSEFSFFHLAHREWFGHDVSDRAIEPVFLSYMFQDFVPYWVRHLARRVIQLHELGILDPACFHVRRRQASQDMKSMGMWALLVIAIVLVIFCALIAHYPSY